ncbi:von Willebrand factor type A domain-containing protein [Rubritalea squalenifaciens DSM 18772]|uniref:von Willebrand factor type A domain-containing protein n=1 Tax=Rubritalea squalenifaciens DSM 18772 TaxID=1123071 RepID=A0A1M6HXM6_9BACT|nr:VWA domain-containing protein [Rubritalea squalenifaciens]SHJ26827.1 von Willebrand factor type A domain-containing protein [Rubritalea squalenifaciens DSM 18772]
MYFESPEWFLLIPVLLVAGLAWRRLQLFTPVRVLVIILLAVILSSPKKEMLQDHMDLWVLLDRSDSTEDLIDKGLPEWKSLLEDARPSKDDRLIFVDYASEISLNQPGTETASFTGKRNLTRTSLAIDHVLAIASEDRPSRVLVFSDGYSTEPVGDILAKLTKSSTPLDYRLIREQIENDFRVARIHMPERIQINEPFLLSVTVKGYRDGEVPVTIYRNDEPLQTSKVSLTNGVGKIEFSTRLNQPGAYQFSAKIAPENDAYDGNNTLRRWIQVTSGPSILIATAYTNDPLAESLRNQGFHVIVEPKASALKVGQLAGMRAVIFNNVPAYEVPSEFLDALSFYVKEQGGGFLMVGGKKSFGSGGYFGSSVADLLPVSMELKNDHRKFVVAMSIVMDRSGSMGASVNGPGGKAVTKMQLAGSGAATAIDLLGSQDYIQVNAVDSETHIIIPPQKIGANKVALMQRARKVRSEGGGIYVYRGLEDAWDKLKKVKYGTRHIILFSDAADSEEPGNYKALLKKITSAGASVSVIGLGSKRDVDAKLLEDIAKHGNGRIFFAENALDIPKLFAQETVTVARSSFVEDAVGAQPTGFWTEISPKPLDWLPSVDGYNLSYVLPDSTTALVSKDEYTAPLVSFARRGLGRTAAISFPMGGEFSKKAREWPLYGDFSQTLNRWLMGNELPESLGMRYKVEGTQLKLDLFYDPEKLGEEFATHPPVIAMQDFESDEAVSQLTWKRMSPGHFSLTHDLVEGSVIRGAVQASDSVIPFGPLQIGNNTEWSFDAERVAELRSLSAQTGGRELTDLSEAWIRPASLHQADIRIPFLILSLLLILVDAYITRTGWQFPKLAPMASLLKSPRKLLPEKTTKTKSAASALTKESSPASSPAKPTKIAEKADVPAKTEVDRRSRFDRAKKRR